VNTQLWQNKRQGDVYEEHNAALVAQGTSATGLSGLDVVLERIAGNAIRPGLNRKELQLFRHLGSARVTGCAACGDDPFSMEFLSVPEGLCVCR
jgi:hypothetical protein